MTPTPFVITGAIFAVVLIVLLILCWRKDWPAAWIGFFVAAFAGQVVMISGISKCAKQLQILIGETAIAQTQKTELICILFVLIFAGLFLMGLVLCIGNRILNKRDRDMAVY